MSFTDRGRRTKILVYDMGLIFEFQSINNAQVIHQMDLSAAVMESLESPESQESLPCGCTDLSGQSGLQLLADPGEARGCSTNTFVII